MSQIDQTTEKNRKVLVYISPPMIRDRSASLAVATTAKPIARRSVRLRGETKAAYEPSTTRSAPEAFVGKPPPTSIIIPATHLPPGVRTPTRPRGRPIQPNKPLVSGITKKPITISAAPKTCKRACDDDNEDDDGELTRKKLRWNIHDDYAEEHWQAKQSAKRARVLAFIDVAGPDIIDLEGPEVIDLVTPSSTAGSSDWNGPEVIDLVTPGSTPGSSDWDWDSEDSDGSIATTSTFDRP